MLKYNEIAWLMEKFWLTADSPLGVLELALEILSITRGMEMIVEGIRRSQNKDKL
jgi:hypothetical protein